MQLDMIYITENLVKIKLYFTALEHIILSLQKSILKMYNFNYTILYFFITATGHLENDNNRKTII